MSQIHTQLAQNQLRQLTSDISGNLSSLGAPQASTNYGSVWDLLYQAVPAVLAALRMQATPRLMPTRLRRLIEIVAVMEHGSRLVDTVFPGIEVTGEQMPTI